MERLGHGVVRLDLGGERVPGQAESLHEPAGNPEPVEFGVGGDVRTVGPDRAIELGQQRDGPDRPDQALPASCEDGQLLSEGRRRGGLAVGVARHR